jgi:hypothetical protein
MNILRDIKKIRKKIKSEGTVARKPFAMAMYRFSMFILDYFTRVRKDLNLDYESFMIIQTVVSHNLYHLNKKDKSSLTYEDLEEEWRHLTDGLINRVTQFREIGSSQKLTISSICLVIGVPKETVRRKINELSKKKILRISNTNGILLGSEYKKIFSRFVPETTFQVSKLLKGWEKAGILKSLLDFKI